MDHLSSGLRGISDPAATVRPRGDRPPTGAGAAADPTEAPPLPRIRDEAILHPNVPPPTTAETMADMHNKVDLADDETVARKSEAEASSEGDGLAPPRDEAEASSRLQPQLAQKSRSLAEQTILQRAQGRAQAAGQAAAAPEGAVNDARLLAEGVIPSMMEGLLNQVHRGKDKRDKKDAARLLLIILKAHGAYVYDHCTRLVDLSLALAREMGEGSDHLDRQVEDGLTYRDVGEVAFFLTKRSARQRDALAAYLGGDELAQDAVLHDLGKIQVPEAVLYKPGPLTPDERRIMERHPVWGAEILEGIPPLHHAIPVTRHHHERWDGQGYPDGVAGEDIPLAARIVCVVDAFDAMVSDRPYRKGLPLDEVTEIIRQASGTQFDPRVAAAFLRTVDTVWSPERQY